MNDLAIKTNNNMVVNDPHYKKHSQEFINFCNGTMKTGNIQNLCELAREFLNQQKDKYRAGTLSLMRIGLKKTILNSLNGNQYNPVYREAVNSTFKAIVPTIKSEKTINQDKYLKRFEVEQLIKHCTKRVSCVVEFLFFTGTRINELTGLRLKNCTIQGDYVSLRIMGKNSKERCLSIPTVFYKKIREFYQGRVYLFETRNHRRYNNSAVYQEIRRQGKRILGKHVGCHTFRHSLATYLLNDRNLNLSSVSKLLGHSSVKITADIYCHAKPEYCQLFDSNGNLK